MSKEQLKERLHQAGFDAALVDPFVDALSDEEMQRVKEEDAVQWFKEMIEKAQALNKEGKTTEEARGITPGEDGTFKCFKCGSRMRLDVRKETPVKEIEIGEGFAEMLATALKDAMPVFPTELEFEIPGLDDRFKALEDTNTKIVTLLESLNKREEDRIKETVENISPASVTRLQYRLRMKDKEPNAPTEPSPDGFVTPDGKTYTGMSGYMGISPGGEA